MPTKTPGNSKHPRLRASSKRSLAVRTSSSQANFSTIVGNQDGAVLLIGLVNAVLITGLMYFLFGIGETIRHHERMNDAVDAGAYATAVIQAHGLNLVALGNMLKLTVAAILAVHLALAGAVAAAAATAASSSASSTLEPTTQSAAALAALALLAGFGGESSSEAEFEARADEIVTAIDDLQTAVRDDLPSIALAQADRLVAAHYQEPAFALRSAPDLNLELPPAPIAPGEALDLCDRAAPYVETMLATEPEYAAVSLPEVFEQCLNAGIVPFEMTDSQLGSEAFQLRVAVNGHSIPALGERGVMLAAWGADDPSSAELAAQRDRQSVWTVAQSEYYFNGPQDEREMLWHMEWKARLRRVRFSGGAGNLGAQVALPLDEVLR